MAERVSETDFDEKIRRAKGLVLLEFYSDSCIPCKQLSPVLGEIEEEYEGKVSIYKVNVNYEEKLAADYRVMSSPTLILFRNGEILDKKTGIQKRAALTEWIEKYIKE